MPRAASRLALEVVVRTDLITVARTHLSRERIALRADLRPAAVGDHGAQDLGISLEDPSTFAERPDPFLEGHPVRMLARSGLG